jgi:hypothetical protein
MDAETSDRAVALVFSRLAAPARSGLMRALPAGPRQRIAGHLESAAGRSPGDLSFVEQVLYADMEAVFSGAGGEQGERLLSEVVPLQVSDLVTVVLLHLAPGQVAAILIHLPAELQGEVVHRLSVQSPEALARRLSREEAGLLRSVDSLWPSAAHRACPEFASEVLREIASPAAQRRLLTAVYRLDQACAEKIRDRVFSFEDLARVEDLELQRLLMGVDHWDLALAMRGAGPGLQRRVNASISERRRRYLVDDASVLKEADQSDVEAVQRSILAAARRLYEEGRVTTYLGSVEAREEVQDEKGDREESGGRAAASGDTTPAVDWRRRTVTTAFAVVSLAAILWVAGVVRVPSTGVRGTGKAAIRGGGGVARAGGGGIGSSRDGGGTDGSRSQDLVKTLGSVQATGDEKREVETGSVLEPGDLLETGPSGQAQLRLWTDAGEAQLEPSSALQVGDPEASREEPPRLELRLGRLWVLVRSPAVEVRSPLAQITASEGSVYLVRTVLDASTTIAVHRGTVWVRPLATGMPPQVLGPEESLRIEPGGRVVTGRHDMTPDWLQPL